VNAGTTLSTTHSADSTDDVAAQWLRARRARSVRRRGGGAGCDDARLVAGGTGGILLPSPGTRVWFPPKVIASGKASKLSAFHLVQRPGNMIRYDFASILGKIDPKSKAILFNT
jgi:hypothetical protein